MAWATYGIAKIHKSVDGNRIEKVLIYVHPTATMNSASYDVSIGFVIDKISKGDTFITILGQPSYWKQGDNAHVVSVGSTKYIRTDGNTIARDNLGELPEY